MGLIQTPEQLQFSFMAIIEGVRTLLSMELKNTYSFSNNEIEDNVSDSDDIPPPIPPRRSSGSLEVSPSASSWNYDVDVKPLPSVPDQSDDDDDDNDECANVDADTDDDEDSVNLSSKYFFFSIFHVNSYIVKIYSGGQNNKGKIILVSCKFFDLGRGHQSGARGR